MSVAKDAIPDALGFTLGSLAVGEKGAAEADGLFNPSRLVLDADVARHVVLAVFTRAVECELPPYNLEQHDL